MTNPDIPRFGVLASILVSLAIFSSGCSFGSLSPAKANGSGAILSMTLGTLQAAGNGKVSRAIVQGGGYLYIRTVGGPTGDLGPFYGPYHIESGGTFSTEDIPAGSFSLIGFLYSATALDESRKITYAGATYTFRQLMSLDDARFSAMVDSGQGGPDSALDDFFAGQVSGEKVNSVVLKAGETTTLGVTLVPFTGSGNTVDLSSVRSKTISSPDGIKREFYELHGLAGSASATLSCTVSPTSGSSATLGALALYDADGKLLASSGAIGSLSSPAALNGTLPSGTTAYLYIEYAAASLSLSFSGSAIPGFTMNFAGSPSVAGKTLYFGVYDVTGVTVTANSGPQGALAGFGVVNLDSSGSGSSISYWTSDFSAFKPFVPKAGTRYLVTAFIDMNGYFSAYTSVSAFSAAVMNIIEPNHGDYSTSSLTLTPDSSNVTFPLSLTQLGYGSAYTYFVTNSGSGSGNCGLSPTTLALAVTKANGDGADSQIKLLENVSLSSALTVSANVYLCSSGTVRKAVSLSGSGVLASFITVSSASTLTLYHVCIDGAGMTMDSISNTSSPILITTGSSLELAGETLVSNITSTRSSSCSEGSAIFANGGTVTMSDSSISNCSNTALTGNGGAIYVSSGSFKMHGSSLIAACSSTTSGGGVYFAAGSIAVIMDGTSKITGCSSNMGGGMYVSNGIPVNLASTVSITGNNATTQGGGVFSDGFLNNSGSNAGISGNTSGTAGAENLYEAM